MHVRRIKHCREQLDEELQANRLQLQLVTNSFHCAADDVHTRRVHREVRATELTDDAHQFISMTPLINCLSGV